MEICNNKEILQILYISRLARQNNSDLLNKEDWLFLVSEIKKDYPKISLLELKNIILDGIKGNLDKVQPLNFRTIYNWVKVVKGNKETINWKYDK